MRVAELWRYPVKSMQGERLESVEITLDGLTGDRRFAIFDLATGFGLTARRAPELLFASARLREDGGVDITRPDGRPAVDDADLSTWLGRAVELRSTADDRTGGPGTRRYENPDDFEDETSGRWAPFVGSGGAFHDSARVGVSLVSRSTTGDWAPRRFRANVLLDATDVESEEDGLVGATVGIGDARLAVGMQIARCVMVTRPQPGGVDRDVDVLRSIHRGRGGCLAVGATVVQAGTVSVGAVLDRLGAADPGRVENG